MVLIVVETSRLQLCDETALGEFAKQFAPFFHYNDRFARNEDAKKSYTKGNNRLKGHRPSILSVRMKVRLCAKKKGKRVEKKGKKK